MSAQRVYIIWSINISNFYVSKNKKYPNISSFTNSWPLFVVSLSHCRGQFHNHIESLDCKVNT